VFCTAPAFLEADAGDMDKADTTSNKKIHGKTGLWTLVRKALSLGTTPNPPPPPPSLPLTKAVGDDWKRQRAILTQGPLQNLPRQTRTAARAVQWERYFRRNDTIAEVVVQVDLKQVTSQVVCEWAVRLFQGRENAALQQHFLAYWAEFRKRGKNNRNDDEQQQQHRATVQSMKAKVVQASSWTDDDGDGLFQAFHRAGFQSKGEVEENALHAMVAGSDAANGLVFWTLWNLSSHHREDDKDFWNVCCHEECERRQQESINTATVPQDFVEVDETDLELLGHIKQLATQGQPIPAETTTQLSFLGKCLLETVRCFPPVWTLPRAWNGNDAISAKLDVPMINGVTDPRTDWDPQRYDITNNNNSTSNDNEPIYLASFGLGKRSCPAGTAAFVAARILLGKFCQTFAELEECQPYRALHSAYLGPTLAVDGEQWFRLTTRTTATQK